MLATALAVVGFMSFMQSCSYDTEDVYLPAHEQGTVNFTVTNLSFGILDLEIYDADTFSEKVEPGYLKLNAVSKYDYSYQSKEYSFTKEFDVITGIGSEEDIASNPENYVMVDGKVWRTEKLSTGSLRKYFDIMVVYPGTILRIEYFPNEDEEGADFTLPGGESIRLTKSNSTYDYTIPVDMNIHAGDSYPIQAVSSYKHNNVTYDLTGYINVGGMSYGESLVYYKDHWWASWVFENLDKQ